MNGNLVRFLITGFNAKFSSLLSGISKWMESHTRLVLIFLVLLAILISAIYLPGDSMLVRLGSDDPWTIATHIYQGQGYSACATSYFPFCNAGNRQTAMREPVSVFMFLAVMLIHPAPLAGVLLEVGLYIGVMFVLYFSLRKEGGAFALFASALWVVSLPVMQEIGNGNGELESAFWLALGIWFSRTGIWRGFSSAWPRSHERSTSALRWRWPSACSSIARLEASARAPGRHPCC